MQYDSSAHCVYDYRYHIVRATKYRYKVLIGDLRLRVRTVCRQVCQENGVDILHGVLSSDHVHMVVSVPAKLAISDLVRKMKGRSSHRIQREFPEIRKRYRGRGYFSTTTGTITDELVLQSWTITCLTLPVPAGSSSHISSDPISELDRPEFIQSARHNHRAWFSIISGPATETGAHPCRKGKRPLRMRVFCFSVLPSSEAEMALRIGYG